MTLIVTSMLSEASVNGKVLTLTYDQPLDAGSVTPGSAFKLGVRSPLWKLGAMCGQIP